MAAPRTTEWVVRECLAAGAPAIQLRDKIARSGELVRQAARLRELTAQHGALLFINDRIDVALAVGADGVHLGPDDLPVSAARTAAPALQLGFSTDDPDLAQDAERAGAAYIGCGAVFATKSKLEVAGELIGPEGVRRVVQRVRLPVIAIGGITPANVDQLQDTGAAGVAVIRAVMAAAQPAQVVRALLSALDRCGRAQAENRFLH